MLALPRRARGAATDAAVREVEEELAEVRWLSLVEVDPLLPGVYEPVREHLGRLISWAARRSPRPTGA